MFDFIKIPFRDSKVSITRPFLCDKVKQFGICEGSCPERHDLCKTLDKECLNIPTKCLISVRLTKIISASHFYGRILKYSTKKNPTKDQDWISVDDLFERIKYELKNINSTPNTIILCKTFTIGEMVMVQTEQGEFYRAVILNIYYGWLTVKVKVILIDMGHTEEVSSNKIFVLPSHLKEHRPVAVEIIISSMEPVVEAGSVLSWPVNTTNLVRSLLEPSILTDLEFICKVELILGINIWVDWILAKKCIKCSHFACKLYKSPLILPNELIKRNFARQNSLLIDKLTNLDKDARVWKKNVFIEKPLIIKKPNISLFSCDKPKNEIDEVIKVQWAHLSEQIISNVTVCYVDGPKCFFVINMEFYGRVIALQRDIDDAISKTTIEKLTYATVGNVCLALAPEQNKYNRVIILQINHKKAKVLFVDYGEFYEVEIDNLLTIPSSLITKLPFQVIECSLSGFNIILQTDIVDQFNNRLLELTDTAIHLKVLSSTTNAKFTGTHYEVVLFKNDVNINVSMADEFSMYVDNTQIQIILSSNYKYKEHETENTIIDDDDDDELDEEELKCQMDLLESLFKYSNQTNETQTVPNSINEKKNESDLKSVNKDNVIANIEQKKCKKIEKKYCLDCNVTPVVPQCFWHQDDTWIYLKLNILSVNDYNTSYTMNTITINVETNSVSYSFTAVLFGLIIDKLCTCRVGFDGIFIKAQKLIKVKYHWPRLLKCTKKHKYIIYDTEFCIAEGKNLNLWCKILNSYKIKAHGEQLSVEYPDSDYEDSVYDENGIFED
ncbi:putative ATP-dependent RNA helicase TDRD12 [Myzus persicae]|uniref:putative ATP-dependent RNA helicase TDRD12 n=1 Tax=Myzus persicae TaxID=13164 RepID=UPI000B9356B5|nr:putative ATP-dependent RNA helicase TDRD12 [Myzus persicae]XP_022182362.1 putative ATP-dependent RNA helicase TDRD12 [Myzus persicae]